MVELMNHSVLTVKPPVMMQGKKMRKAGMSVLAMGRAEAEFEMHYCKGRTQRIMSELCLGDLQQKSGRELPV